MKNFNDFLHYIHGNQTSIIKSHDGKFMKIINKEDISLENKKGEIYYVVNSGGHRDVMIDKFNAVFIDLDYGRDSNKDYYPLDIISKYKKEKIEEINSFSIAPTFIVETRNGLHVYWVLDNCTDKSKWKECMLKLIAKFSGDDVVHNPARLMRVPFTNWMKDKTSPFFIDILEFNDVRYNIDTILSELKDVVAKKADELEKSVGVKRSIYKHLYNSDTKTPSDNNIEIIKNKDVYTLKELLHATPMTFQNQGDFYRHITSNIDLGEFLGINNSTRCKCVFHNDNNPSAGIFVTERDQLFFKCHSSQCGFMGNIIRCVERLQGCNRPKAIQFIKDVYQLEIVESDWQKEQKSILEENKRMIREGELEETHPEIYALIKKYTGLIYELHDIAMDNIYDEKLTDNDDNTVFFSSLREITGRMNAKSDKRIADRIGLLSFLQLLNKLPEDQVPESYLSRAKEIQSKNKQKKLVNFYSIPSYCDKTLEKSKTRSDMYRDKNVTMKGWSRELLQRTFGDEIADETYPQFTYRKPTEKSNNRTLDIHNITLALLENKDYVLEKEIIDECLKCDLKLTQSSVQIKKSLQEMLDIYGLERIRANKIIKEQYGMAEVSGYPFIIVKKVNSYII